MFTTWLTSLSDRTRGPGRVEFTLRTFKLMFEKLMKSLPTSMSAADSGKGVTEERFLPPEEIVMQYLSESGGKTWQRDIVTQMEWSASKTSRVLSGLEDEGQVVRLPMGRQKIVSLPNQLPGAFGVSKSPLGKPES